MVAKEHIRTTHRPPGTTRQREDRNARPGKISCECGQDHTTFPLSSENGRPCRKEIERFGGSEGTQKLTIEKKDSRLAIFNVYVERHREHFPVDKSQALTGISAEARRSISEDGDNPKKTTRIVGDFNVRPGKLQVQEGYREARGGELYSGNRALAKHLANEIDKANARVVHGRACDWKLTFKPNEGQKEAGL